MLILRDDLFLERNIVIDGSETWLEPIYAAFTQWGGKQDSIITGTIQTNRDDYGFVTVRGRVSYEPKLPCSRCSDPLTWPINKTISAEFRPFNSELPQDHDLSRDELDYYYLDEKGNLSLFEIVNDTLQLALPDRLIKLAEDGQHCSVCLVKVCDQKVLSTSGDDEANNPFAKLKDLLKSD